MKKLITIFALSLVLCVVQLHAQELTTVILVRHAEKDMTASTPDPELSPEGVSRSQALMHALGEMDIDAIYSTPYKRTQNTVRGVAQAHGVEIFGYDPFDREAFFSILDAHKGETLLFSGHSNTVPSMLNWLTGSESWSPFEEDQYDDLFMVVIGEGNPKVFHLQYGAPDVR